MENSKREDIKKKIKQILLQENLMYKESLEIVNSLKNDLQQEMSCKSVISQEEDRSFW